MSHYLAKRYARSLLRLLPHDCEQEGVLAECGLSQAALAGEGEVSVETYSLLFSVVLLRLQPVLHGDQAEHLSQFSGYRLILNAMIQAGDLGEAIILGDALMRRLLPGGEGFKLVRNGDSTEWQFQLPDIDGDSDWSAETLSVTQLQWMPGLRGHAISLWMWHRLACWLTGSYIALDSVAVTDSPPSSPSRVPSLFDCPLKFDRDSCSISFAAHYLEHPVNRSADQVQAMLERFPCDLFYVDQRSHTDAERIASMIGQDFSRPIPGVEEVAKRMNMSVPTLHRHLQKEHTSYQKIKNDCRYQAAVDFLGQEAYTVDQVANLLGYSDTSTFYRAFKKWAGMTPMEYRASKPEKSHWR